MAVFVGPSAVFTNVYNPRAFIERKHEFKATLVKKGATIGANATIICGVVIGRYAFFPSKNLGGFGDGGMVGTDDDMVYYPVPLHKMKVFDKRCRMPEALAEAERAVKEILSLPIEPLMTEDEQSYVCETIRKLV